MLSASLGPMSGQSPLVATLIVVGALTLTSIAYTLVRVLASIFLLPGTLLSTFGPKGSWAVVTGASDGLGKEFALQLARKGFNLVLVSRTQGKLEALAKSIEGVQVETLPIDFSKPTETDYVHLENTLAGKKVAILVNNVGQSHSIPVFFTDTEQAELQNIITINCMSTLRVTKTVLPHMLPQKKGLILTMGSFAGVTPTALLATYSGSKAFLQAWNNALATELAPQGITCHMAHGYLVTSAMSKVRRTSWLIPNEKAFVKSALGKIGRRGGSVGFTYSGTPYWSHALLGLVVTTATLASDFSQ